MTKNYARLLIATLLLCVAGVVHADNEAPEAVAPEGWQSVITNGNLGGSSTANYWMRDYTQDQAKPVTITDGVGRNGSRGIVVKKPDTTGDENAEFWDTEFWLVFNESVPMGTRLHVEFDYRASQNATVYTQAHGTPRDYHDRNMLGTIDFTTEWQTFSKDIVVTEQMATCHLNGPDGLLSVEFQLNVEKTATDYFFDNFGAWIQFPEEAPEKVAPLGWTSIISNGNLATGENKSFRARLSKNDVIEGATIMPGAGTEGSRGIVVKSPETRNDEEANPWDTGFWVVFDRPLTEGTKLHVEFDYRANQSATVYTQAHGNPNYYHHYEMLGDIDFTTEWQTFSKDIVVTADMAKKEGLMSINFQLNVEKAPTNYYFDNFGVWIDYIAPEDVPEWTDIVVNGDMEDDDVQCFYKAENLPESLTPATISDGIGVDGSRAIMVHASDAPVNTWDSEFFVRLPYKMKAGTPYRFTMDVRADVDGLMYTMIHDEPTNYLWYALSGVLDVQTTWNTLTFEGVFDNNQAGNHTEKQMQTLVFCLSLNPNANNFYFDNVKFEVPTFMLGDLEYNPAALPINFTDSITKAVCVKYWDTDHDGQLSIREAAAVENITECFSDDDSKQLIENFDEFKYFTGVTSIEYPGFYNCTNLKSITLPNSLKTIGPGAFLECSSLENVKIPTSVTTIDEGAFQYCSSLESINLPNSVTYIGGGAFHGCSSLKSFTFPEFVRTIEDGTFSGCRALTAIDIPRTITSIGERAFSGCTGLKSVTIPGSVTHLGVGAFIGCTGLKDVLIPNTIETIENETFMFCEELTTVNIPSSVTTIGNYAFDSCSSLTSITIPGSVTSIEGSAFSDCLQLEEVHSLITEPFPIPGCFFNMIDDFHFTFTEATLYVPAGTKEKYLTTNGWKEFGDRIVEVEMALTPMANNQQVSYGEYGSISPRTNLSATIIDNVYYNIGPNDGWYDASDQCIVLGRGTSDEVMQEVYDQGLFSSEFIRCFNGMALELPEGKVGMIIDAQTTGGMKLKMKFGIWPAFEWELINRQEIPLQYDCRTPTLVYIYADASEVSYSKSNGTNEFPSLKIYGISVERIPGPATDISDTQHLNHSEETGNGKPVEVYDLTGRLINSQSSARQQDTRTLKPHSSKGLLIVRMSDGRVKKVIGK